MSGRRTLLRVAVALLYLGPVMAGMAGPQAAQVPVFVLLFLVWLVVLRPRTWPQRAADWRGMSPWAALAGRALVQGVLVLLCLGAGQIIGTLTGPVSLPLWLPPVVSAAAILLGRALENPAAEAATEAFLEDALRRVSALTDDGGPDDLPRRLGPLLALDDTAPDDLVDRLLDEALDGDPAAAGFSAVTRHLRDAGSGQPALRRGVIRMATDPALADMGKGSEAVAVALFIAGTAPDLLTLFLDRAEALYAARPDLWGDYPSPGTLREVAGSAGPPEIALRLRRMADRLEADDS